MSGVKMWAKTGHMSTAFVWMTDTEALQWRNGTAEKDCQGRMSVLSDSPHYATRRIWSEALQERRRNAATREVLVKRSWLQFWSFTH